MATVALELAWIDTTGTVLFIAWEMTVGNWLGAPALTGVPTLTVNGSGGPVATAHGVAKKGTSRWIARYSLASPVAAGATVTVSASAGSCANGAITSSPALSGAAVTNNSTGASAPTSVYVDLDEEPGGLGTAAAPFCSLNEAKVYIASGVTVLATGGSVQTGTAHEWDGVNGWTINSVDGWTLTRWPGASKPVLSGACPILGFDGNTTAGYRVDGMDVEPEFVGYGVGDLTIAVSATNPKTGLSVTFNWPSYGMEEAIGGSEAAQISACQTATSGIGLWAYDSTNDRLWVHSTQGDSSPASDSLDYYVLMQSAANAADKVSGPNESNGASIISSDNWTIDGVDFKHWMERSTGYAVFGQSCTGSTLRNISASCAGRHGIGFAGNDCSTNTIEDCVVDTAGTATDSAIIFYGGSTNVQGCVAQRLTVHCNTILRWDSTDSVRTPLRIGGAAAYTDATGAPGLAGHSSDGATQIDIAGVIYRNCDVYAWADTRIVASTPNATPNACFVFTGTHDSPLVLTLPELYPVQLIECVFVGPVWGACSDGGCTSFVRCYFSGTMGTTNGTAATDAFFRALDSEALFVSCVFSGLGESGTVASALLRSQNSNGEDRAHVIVLGCSLYQRATDASTFDVRRDGTGTDIYGRITAVGCVFRMADDGSSTSRLISGTTVSVAGGIRDRIDFTGNVYDVLIPNNNFGFPDSTINTQAEFTSAADPTGVYDVDLSAAFESNTTLRPAFNSALTLMVAPAASYRGIDTVNNHKYGAWQMFDPMPARMRGSRRDEFTVRPILG